MPLAVSVQLAYMRSLALSEEGVVDSAARLRLVHAICCVCAVAKCNWARHLMILLHSLPLALAWVETQAQALNLPSSAVLCMRTLEYFICCAVPCSSTCTNAGSSWD